MEETATQGWRLVWLLSLAAAVAYSYRLGAPALGPSEAYSAFAAAQPTLGTIARNALQFDPGKPVLYHVLLHCFCTLFGASEVYLRSFSLAFGIASVALVFAYGQELFGYQVGLAAAAIWAFNPLALLFARWARMYSMFVALAVGHLLAMAKVRRQANPAITLLAGVLGAAMLYTHLAAVFVIGADLLVIMREFRQDGHSVSWRPVLITLILFLPFIRDAVVQSNALLYGHWLDWIGVYHGSIATRVTVITLVAGCLSWCALGARWLSREWESVLRCSLYVAVPPVAVAAGSLAIRPMFAVRYVAPSFAAGAVVLAWALDQMGKRVRNDVVFAIMAFFVTLAPLSYAAQDQPWRKIAALVAATSRTNETVFFEGGFFSPARVIDQQENEGFPQGFFLVPFKYYFKQPNPAGALPADNPVLARRLIAYAVRKAGGAWLISGKAREDAFAELPSGSSFRIDYEQNFSRVLLIHICLATQRMSESASPRFMSGVSFEGLSSRSGTQKNRPIGVRH